MKSRVSDVFDRTADWWVLYQWVWKDNESLWQETEIQDLVLSRRLAFQQLIDSLEPNLGELDFTKAIDEELVSLWVQSWIANLGVQVANVWFGNPPEEIPELVLQTLVRHDLLISREANYHPFYFALNCHVLSSLRDRLWLEIERRGTQHLGFPAGVLNLLLDIDRLGDGPPITSVFKRVLSTMERKIPQRSKRRGDLHEYLFNFEDYQHGELSADWHIHSQIVMTVTERCRKYEDGFAGLKDSLKGQLDIIPKAVSDDLLDEMRKEYKRGTQTVALSQEVHAEPKTRDTTIITQAFVNDVRRLISTHTALSAGWKKKLLTYLSVYLEDKNQEEMAQQLGVSTRTLRNYDRRLQELLSHPRDRQGPVPKK